MDIEYVDWQYIAISIYCPNTIRRYIRESFSCWYVVMGLGRV